MEIQNRVAASEIVVFDPATLVSAEAPVELDLAPFLHRGIVLREKEFRAHVEALDAGPLQGRDVAVFCSTEAVVPTWAWMLVASRLAGPSSVTHRTIPMSSATRVRSLLCRRCVRRSLFLKPRSS